MASDLIQSLILLAMVVAFWAGSYALGCWAELTYRKWALSRRARKEGPPQ